MTKEKATRKQKEKKKFITNIIKRKWTNRLHKLKSLPIQSYKKSQKKLKDMFGSLPSIKEKEEELVEQEEAEEEEEEEEEDEDEEEGDEQDREDEEDDKNQNSNPNKIVFDYVI